MHKAVIPLAIVALILVIYFSVYAATPVASAGASAHAASDKFKMFSKLDNSGGDLVPWDSPANFGYTDIEACASRCLDNPQCHSFGFDPAYVNKTLGKTGYCTLKSHATEPTKPWSETGLYGLKL